MGQEKKLRHERKAIHKVGVPTDRQAAKTLRVTGPERADLYPLNLLFHLDDPSAAAALQICCGNRGTGTCKGGMVRTGKKALV